MRSDFIEARFDPDGALRQLQPLPKIMILDADLVIGLAGDDPRGGMTNILTLWAEEPSPAGLRNALQLDGDMRRQYLMLSSDGEVWSYRSGEWSEPAAFGWIGDPDAARALNPDPWDDQGFLQATPQEREDAAAKWRAAGASDDEIELLLAGTVRNELGPEIAFRDALHGSGPSAGGIVTEAHLIDGKFQFQKQSITKVFGTPIIKSEQGAVQALMQPDLFVSHLTRSGGESFPATLEVEFPGAVAQFRPCFETGYRMFVRPLDPESQRYLFV